MESENTFEINDLDFPTGNIGHTSSKSTFDLNCQDGMYWEEDTTPGERYGKYDPNTFTLSFFKDGVGKYENNQVLDDGSVIYTDVEQSRTYSQLPWYSVRTDIAYVNFLTKISPIGRCAYFYGMKNLVKIMHIHRLDTSNVTDMSGMFNLTQNSIGPSVETKLEELDVSNFDTSNVTDMSKMFFCCDKITQLDVSNFDTSKVRVMDSMFAGCKSLVQLDVSNFDTSNVRGIVNMFTYMLNLQTLDLSNFDTSNVTNMYNVFSECKKLTKLDISSFDTTNITDLEEMFRSCKKLEYISLTNFDTSGVTNMKNMFCDCDKLSRIFVSDTWDTDSVTISTDMFKNCYSLKHYDSNFVDKTKAYCGSDGYLTYLPKYFE